MLLSEEGQEWPASCQLLGEFVGVLAKQIAGWQKVELQAQSLQPNSTGAMYAVTRSYDREMLPAPV